MLAFKPPIPEDHELIFRYQKTGDLKILATLFSRYTSMVYGVCMKYLRNREDARDGVMQLFEKLVKVLKEHPVENFKSWLYVTTRNHCLMQLRAQKGKFREGISTLFMESEFALHLEEDPELEQNLGKLEKCIAELAEDQKKCVQLFFIQERCYKDIAGITGFDLNKVKSYIQNGKRNLRICMERNG